MEIFERRSPTYVQVVKGVEDGYASTQHTSIVTPSEDVEVDVAIEVGSADIMLRYYESYLEPIYILEDK